MQQFCIVIGSLILAATAGSARAQLSFEDMTDRSGGDYMVLPIPAPIPPGPGPRVGAGACRMACNEDFRCKAWSYEPPALGAPAGTCRLKKDVPPAAFDPCCVSGVKPIGAITPWGDRFIERDTYRSGDVMHVFALQQQDDRPEFCEYACLIHVDWLTGDRCLSWSWEMTPNKDHLCKLFRDEPGGVVRPEDASGKLQVR